MNVGSDATDMVFCVFGIAEFGGIYFYVEKTKILVLIKIIGIWLFI